jgi:hypothetical protein
MKYLEIDMDDYNVYVYLRATTSGSKMSEFPDNIVTVQFDATDVDVDTMLSKFLVLLNGMGYITSGKQLVMIDEDI